MEALIVVSKAKYNYEFDGIVIPAKKARAVTNEEKKQLKGNVQFSELLKDGTFKFEERVPDEYKAPGEQLSDALQRIAELENGDAAKKVTALQKEVADLKAEAQLEIESRDKEIAALKAEIAELKKKA